MKLCIEMYLENFRKKFKSQKTKMKIIKFLDWNYKESAENFANFYKN
jgi:uncharacterized protein YnzC (UPF0291/DUF896 family)